MANEENLIKFTSDQNREEARKNGRKGGIKSGEARRRKKTMKDNLELLLSLPVKQSKIKNVMKNIGIDDEDLTNDMAMQVSMLMESLKGNVQAYKEIRDTIGEKPKDDLNVKVEDGKKLKDVFEQIGGEGLNE